MKATKREFEEGIMLILLSSSFVSIFGLCIKFGLKEVSIWTLTFLRFLIPLFLALPVLWWCGTFKKMWPLKNVQLQFYRGAAVVISQLALIYYLTRASLLNATLLWGTGPIFIPLIARIFYKQPIYRATWISLGISFVGIVLILKPDKGLIDPFSLFGLISGLGMAFSQILYGINTEKGDPGENLFYLFFFASILSFIPLLIWGEHDLNFHISGTEIFVILGLGLATLGNQLFRGLAYRRAKPALLTPFLYFSVVLSGILDWAFFQKTPDLLALIGSCLVIGAAFLKWLLLRNKGAKMASKKP